MKDFYKEYDAMIMPVGVGVAKHLDNSLDMLDESTSVLDEFLQAFQYQEQKNHFQYMNRRIKLEIVLYTWLCYILQKMRNPTGQV